MVGDLQEREQSHWQASADLRVPIRLLIWALLIRAYLIKGTLDSNK